MNPDDSHKISGNSSFQKSFWNYLSKSSLGIFKKFLFSFLVISLVPLLAFGIYTVVNISTVKDDIVNHAIVDIDQKTQETLELQAVLTAEGVQKFYGSVRTIFFFYVIRNFPPMIFSSSAGSISLKSGLKWEQTNIHTNLTCLYPCIKKFHLWKLTDRKK